MSLQKKKTIQINPNDDLNNITNNNNDSDEELINDNDFDDLLNNFSNQNNNNNTNNNTKLSKKDISESILGINPDDFINDILKKGLLE